MAVTATPIFTQTPHIESNTTLIAAVATNLYDFSGTIGTDIFKCYTAGSNGSFVNSLKAQYVVNANATTTSVACIMRVFVSSATSGTTTAANTWLIGNISLPATGALTTTTLMNLYELPLNFQLNAGWTILVKITAAQSANTGYQVTVIGSDY